MIASMLALGLAASQAVEATTPVPVPPQSIEVVPSPPMERSNPPQPRPNRPVMPKSEPASWIRSYDYPVAAREEGRTGETRVQLSVTRWGGVADCRIFGSSGHPDLDTATCDLLAERARFYPALDKDMQPVAAQWTHSFKWSDPVSLQTPVMAVAAPRAALSLPAPPLLYFPTYEIPGNTDYPAAALAAGAEGWATVRLEIDEKGKVAECSIASSTGNAALDEASCAGARMYESARPAMGLDGKPTKGIVEREVWWRLPQTSTNVPFPAPMPPPSQRRDPSPFLTSGKASVRMIVGADGTVSDCQITNEGGLAERSPFEGMCANGERNRDIPIFKDKDGNPVPKVFSLTLAIDVEDVATAEAEEEEEEEEEEVE